MKTIRFTIRGNQKDPQGNPIPYKRTLRNTFSAVSKDYQEWKEYVRSELDRTGKDIEADAPFKPFYSTSSFPYPDLCEPGQKVSVRAEIYWKNGHHGDGDNVLKGILDALFYDDKCVWEGHYRSFESENKIGRVDVVVLIE